MSTDGQDIKWRRNITENFNRLNRLHTNVTDRRKTDGFTTTYSERKREFTYVKKYFSNDQPCRPIT